ncbi:restriction endonuclease [Pseudomonas frederiksbergensis]|uniref:Restriction endonuclease n=1 Tax=Pseudomonas frederiksbergensis TaxID=104087 RepID=A0A2S8H8N4_9PSED|nr:restriction endonuclease [Pseudomonas frederiksbergensis]PQO98866.1 restriction endonuclease [Pseudomonas frederiksbergensis]
MSEQFHYPPDIFELLVETIPRLVKGKKSVVLFFQGAGVPEQDWSDILKKLDTTPESINKFDIARTVLTRLNQHGDSGLGPRREIIRRVTQFDSFESCWENERLKAKGLVASVREAVNAKDAFTRMKQERDAERNQAQARFRDAKQQASTKRAEIEDIKTRLFSLFSIKDKPQERGKLLESVLNDLFRAYDIHVRENFMRKAPDSPTVMEQIDGVIDLGGAIHLVEMKWLKDPVGVADFGPHLVRVMGRANASGIFISNSEFTQPAITQCAEFLNLKTTFLCSLEEIVMLLQRQGDLVEFLKTKSQAAIINKQPFLKILN